MSTYLIIGATGTVGAPLVQLLTSAGHQVRAATRDPASYQGPGEAVAFQVGRSEGLQGLLDGVDGVFLLSPPGHADQFAALEPLVRALAGSTVRRVVTMTAQGVQVDDAIPFRRLELAIEAMGKDFIHLRPTWFADNFHSFWGHGIRQAKTLALPAGEARVAFIDSRDIASAAFAALTRDDVDLNVAYELTGPESLTHAQAAAVLSASIDEAITYVPIDEDAFRVQLAPSGLPEDYIELLVGLFALVRMGVAEAITQDVQRLTGEPPRSLATYAADRRERLI